MKSRATPFPGWFFVAEAPAENAMTGLWRKIVA